MKKTIQQYIVVIVSIFVCIIAIVGSSIFKENNSIHIFFESLYTMGLFSIGYGFTYAMILFSKK